MVNHMDSLTAEVMQLLAEKRRRESSAQLAAQTSQEYFVRKAAEVIDQTEQWFKPLEYHGITCERVPLKISRDFGVGVTEAELQRLVVRDGGEEIISIEPFSSQLQSHGLRFNVTLPVLGRKVLADGPKNSAGDRLLGWHIYLNEDDKSAAAEYQPFNEQAVMSYLKQYLS